MCSPIRRKTEKQKHRSAFDGSSSSGERRLIDSKKKDVKKRIGKKELVFLDLF